MDGFLSCKDTVDREKCLGNNPGQIFFCDLVGIELIHYRMKANQLINESNETGRLRESCYPDEISSNIFED